MSSSRDCIHRLKFSVKYMVLGQSHLSLVQSHPVVLFPHHQADCHLHKVEHVFFLNQCKMVLGQFSPLTCSISLSGAISSSSGNLSSSRSCAYYMLFNFSTKRSLVCLTFNLFNLTQWCAVAAANGHCHQHESQCSLHDD